METYDASWPAAGGGQFPNPDGPPPGPFPPIPGPYPEIPWPPRQPFPDFPLELPRDFWRCRRLGPVSGRYEGGRNGATALLRATLDLRVDIDERLANSPVMNRISGDFYSSRFVLDGPLRSFRTMKTYRESWIVDNPRVLWRRCSVAITGRVRWWKGSHLPTDVTVIIPWNLGAMGPAQVTMVEGASTDVYSCAYRSDSFRQVQLETDYCHSVNANPQLPAYDTHAHTNRPAGTPQRVLTVQESYREAGIEIAVTSAHTDIDDSAAQFQSWNVAELHDAMEVHFSQLAGGWPRWHMWGLLAGTFEQSSVGGIMFDYSGANEPPERQGFAVFRKHSWFTGLPGGVPANQAAAEAMRKFLYTWVHEAGHAFNFLHSWDKSRPSARSWMNYDWKYDAIHGANSFWANFEFRFDDEELIHLRHGDRSSVIMGGDPWSSGGHLESPPEAMTQTDSDAPLELLLRSKGYFEFMEPVTIEARLRNTGTSPVGVDARLTTESGNLAVFVRKPTGQVRRFVPVSCHLAEPARPATGRRRRSRSRSCTRTTTCLWSTSPPDWWCIPAPATRKARC